MSIDPERRCADGHSLKGGSIPVFDPQKTRDRPTLAELQRKCDSSKPLAMFRSTETEFILCYDCKLTSKHSET